MRVPPTDLDEGQLRELLDREWGLRTAHLAYAPLGYGSHHWVATTSAGGRRFVTVDELNRADPNRSLDRLGAAMNTAVALRDEAGLDFVIAPDRTSHGQAISTLHGTFAVTVFPFVEGCAWPDDEGKAGQTAGALSRVLARLHAETATVSAIAATDDLEIEARDDLENALAQVDEAWDPAGPYTEGCRTLLASAAQEVRLRLDSIDRLASAIRGRGESLVITHGEPKPDNLLVTESGPALIDWDTVLLAPAGRDLWWLSADPRALTEYEAVAGRKVSQAELSFYRSRWDLTDLALYVKLLRGPHQADADTDIAWRELQRRLHGQSA